MKQAILGPSVPQAAICLNKSRIKVYHKETAPTYYLKKGDSFQIELYNPTQNTILAKIKLNNQLISQGGLVLRPAERVFLERYIDVAKKFVFDTYEVSNTQESINAIEQNGDFSVDFYNESVPVPQPTFTYNTGIVTVPNLPNLYLQGYNRQKYNQQTSINYLSQSNSTNTGGLSSYTSQVTNSGISNRPILRSKSLLSETKTEVTLDSVDTSNYTPLKKIKSIETGRVEAGDDSGQKLSYVNKKFDFYPFHSIEYKLLPISQKINTIGDISVKQYCSTCGRKYGKVDMYCSGCGTKI